MHLGVQNAYWALKNIIPTILARMLVIQFSCMGKALLAKILNPKPQGQQVYCPFASAFQ